MFSPKTIQPLKIQHFIRMRLKTPTVDIAPVKLYPYVKSKTQTHAFEFASCFCPYRLYPMTHCVPMGRNRLSFKAFFDGRSVIIGFQKTQIYQRFAGSRQEVFILKIQNDENNAAQQDNGRRFHIEIKQKQGQYFLLFLFDSIELLLHHSLQKHPRLLLQRYSDRSV